MFRVEQDKPTDIEVAMRAGVLLMLDKHNCEITRAEREHVMRLSEVKFGIFEECVKDLAAAGLLNSESFRTFYSRQLFHIAKVQSSTVSITRKLVRTASSTKIYLPRKKEFCDTGHYAGVVKGYDADPIDEGASAIWALKTLHRERNGCADEIPLKERQKNAKREVRCNRLIGRAGYFFKAGKDIKIALSWQPGSTLYVLKDDIKKFSFDGRLKWCIDLLKDLVALHQAFLVHADLHAKNVVIDYRSNKAALIDLGMARKSGPGWQEMSTDMLQFEANILQSLFANELELAEGVQLGAIQRLQAAICTPFETCTSLQALNYCKGIAQNLAGLSDEKINAIALRTLDRKTITVNDVLCGSKRPQAMRMK